MNEAWLEYMSRRRLIRACLGVIAVAGARCARRGDRSAERDSTLRILYATDESSFRPASDDVPKFLVFLPLVSYDTNEEWACGRATPGLAERWSHSADYREWTVSLRRDVKWHDGVPVTAHDIKFTMDLWGHPAVNHWARGPLESITVLDDHTFRAVYKRPDKSLLDGWSVFYPRHRLQPLDPEKFWEWDFWIRPVGNGPYRYVGHTPRTMMEFEANPDYYKGRPRIGRLIIKFGAAASLVELLSGSVDAVEAIGSVDAARLAGDRRYQVGHTVVHGAVVIYWNHRHPLFRDPNVRRALTLAIDRRELHGALDLPENLPITDALYTRCQFAGRRLSSPWPHDPAAARRLLDEAGWLDRGGVRQRHGQGLVFTAMVPNNWLQAPQAAVFVQDQLRRVGVRMEIQTLESRVVADALRGGKFEAGIWICPATSGFHAEFFGEGSPIGYRNAKVAQLLSAAQAAVDEEERDRIYAEMAPIFRAELPATFLYPKVDFYAASRRVGGFGRDLFMYADRLWLDDRSER